jgi:hypothetical protein
MFFDKIIYGTKDNSWKNIIKARDFIDEMFFKEITSFQKLMIEEKTLGLDCEVYVCFNNVDENGSIRDKNGFICAFDFIKNKDGKIKIWDEICFFFKNFNEKFDQNNLPVEEIIDAYKKCVSGEKGIMFESYSESSICKPSQYDYVN